MKERMGEAFAGAERLTVMGRQLHAGDAVPEFRLDYLDLADLTIRTVGLADSAGMVRLLNVVNSLERPLCQLVTRQWEALCATLPPDACIYTVSSADLIGQHKKSMNDGNSGQNIDRRRCAESCVQLLDRALARKHTKEESSGVQVSCLRSCRSAHARTNASYSLTLQPTNSVRVAPGRDSELHWEKYRYNHFLEKEDGYDA